MLYLCQPYTRQIEWISHCIWYIDSLTVWLRSNLEKYSKYCLLPAEELLYTLLYSLLHRKVLGNLNLIKWGGIVCWVLSGSVASAKMKIIHQSHIKLWFILFFPAGTGSINLFGALLITQNGAVCVCVSVWGWMLLKVSDKEKTLWNHSRLYF